MLSLKNVARWCAVGMVAFFCAKMATAAPPWQLVNFTKIEADPNKSYDLSERNGPWTIMVASFVGDGAESDAHNLVIDLRKNHKVKAYYFVKQYDFTEKVQGLGFQPDGRPKVMVNASRKRLNEVAVFAGDFSRVDDPDAQSMLKTIKSIRPESLKTSKSLSFAEYRRELRQQQQTTDKGPLSRAFIGTNPLLPPDYFNPKGIDKFVLEMNQDFDFSLLKCPGKYSVMVAKFKGASIIDQKKVKDVQSGLETKSKLDEAGEKAHKLTLALRKLAYEAYEYHDRESSMVTVGSFEFVNVRQEDGTTALNPAIQQIINELGANTSGAVVVGHTTENTLPNRRGNRANVTQSPLASSQNSPQSRGSNDANSILTGIQPKRVDGMFLEIHPAPIEVPKRSLTSDYARREN